MPCTCGDYCCWSCGPAQGNWRCPICNEWASEDCEHIDHEGTGQLKPEFAEEAKKIADAERAAERAYEEAVAAEREME
jgi:hypothetical protein